MKMMTLIAAGGSGIRILEAVLHLCAAGVGPERLRVFAIDPDSANGNVDRVRQLVSLYCKCQSAFAADAQPSDARHTAQYQPFFQTKLDLLDGPQGLRVWSPVQGNQQFRQLLNYDGLRSDQKDVVDLLFTSEELEMPMESGFRGHPALGAAALSLLPLYRDDDLWKRVVAAIRHDVTLGDTRVMVVGSVFGGTGASAIHPIVRYIRNLPEANWNNLFLAAVALVPYFRFTNLAGENKQEVAAQSQWFALATRSAAEYYEHLKDNKDWDFDLMYWLGDDAPVEVPYSKGGPKQKNPGHFVDLLGGLACLDFAAASREKLSNRAGMKCYYSGPAQEDNASIVTWDAIPMANYDRNELRKQLLRFHLAMSAHAAFFGSLLRDGRLQERPYCVPWYSDRLDGTDHSLFAQENQRRLDDLREYLAHYYFPWWNEVHSQSARVRLFNRAAWECTENRTIVKSDRLGNLLYPDNPKLTGLDTIDLLFDAAVRASRELKAGNNAAATYLGILGNAAREVVQAAES